MKSLHLSAFLFICIVASTIAPRAFAELKLPAIISDHMVLQQQQPNRLWGWDTPGAKIKVSFAGQTHIATAADDGRWETSLAPMPASAAPRVLTVEGTTRREIREVLVGEVWLCGGQSNMRWNTARAWNAEVELAAARRPNIRLLSVPTVGKQELQNDIDARWVQCAPDTVGDFSAVGYFYGRALHEVLGVPIGLIDCSWGGSAAETWVARKVLAADPRFRGIMEQWDKTEATFDYAKLMANYEKALEKWEKNSAAAKAAGKPAPAQPRKPNNLLTGGRRPGNAYNAMLYPIIGYGIKGAIWYQGEANAGRAAEYRELFPFVIQQWRKEWKQGDFPFYWVQLTNFRARKTDPNEKTTWAEIREAQTLAQRLSNTGQAVIIDLGESDDIHPRNKHDVAMRLVRWPLVKDYGKTMKWRSPEYKTAAFDAGKALINFDTFGDTLRTVDTKELNGFAICGADKKWHWASARIIAPDQVEVSSPDVPQPIAVRYAWADNPVCNLYSAEGLPATPFRTDAPAE